MRCESVEVKPSHQAQELEIWHDDGPIYLNEKKARELIHSLQMGIAEMKGRKVPPCPAPYYFDGKVDEKRGPQAEADRCSGDHAGEMLCSGQVEKSEYYLRHFFQLRNWINEMFEYHRKCGCVNLAKLEGKNANAS